MDLNKLPVTDASDGLPTASFCARRSGVTSGNGCCFGAVLSVWSTAPETIWSAWRPAKAQVPVGSSGIAGSELCQQPVELGERVVDRLAG